MPTERTAPCEMHTNMLFWKHQASLARQGPGGACEMEVCPAAPSPKLCLLDPPHFMLRAASLPYFSHLKGRWKTLDPHKMITHERAKKEKLSRPNFLSKARRSCPAMWRLKQAEMWRKTLSPFNKLISQKHFNLIFLSVSCYCTLSWGGLT